MAMAGIMLLLLSRRETSDRDAINANLVWPRPEISVGQFPREVRPRPHQSNGINLSFLGVYLLQHLPRNTLINRKRPQNVPGSQEEEEAGDGGKDPPLVTLRSECIPFRAGLEAHEIASEFFSYSTARGHILLVTKEKADS